MVPTDKRHKYDIRKSVRGYLLTLYTREDSRNNTRNLSRRMLGTAKILHRTFDALGLWRATRG